MSSRLRKAQSLVRADAATETGAVSKEAAYRLALVYPSPYAVAMSSLGYQTIYRLLNEQPDIAADRATLPDDLPKARNESLPLLTIERERAVGDYGLLAFSVAYELEIAGVIASLELAGLPVLAADRTQGCPLIVAGGPLTFSNPAPLGPFFDVILMGEAEETVLEMVDAARESSGNREAFIAKLTGRPGFYVPSIDGDRLPAIAKAPDALLPARSQIISEKAALRSMFLIEPCRGCSRGCTYCVMRRSTNDGMRVVDPKTVLEAIPEAARRVGLVGAAVTDHPGIKEIVRSIVDSDREVGISSLRADRLDDELVGLLARGGYRTLTTAADGASERLRRTIERRTWEHHLLAAAALATKHGLRTFKMYMMVGVPGETDDDIDELIRFAAELHAVHPRVALGVAPFVAKRNTPLDGEPFAGIKVVDERLKRLRAGLRGHATVRPTSARWAWVEYMLAQGNQRSGLAVREAEQNGGSFAAYKKAFKENECEPMAAGTRIPTSAELVEKHREKRLSATI